MGIKCFHRVFDLYFILVLCDNPKDSKDTKNSTICSLTY